MALSDFFRGSRKRGETDWNPHDESRQFGRPNYPRDEEGFERRGWRPGSDYHGNNPERYAGSGAQFQQFERRPEYRGSENDWRGSSDWGHSYNDRGENAYGGSGTRGSQESNARWWNDLAGYPSEQGSQSMQHRGRGPRGYRRSDERIHEDVCECLTDDEHIDASNIQVTVKDGEVTLSGTVNSRGEKRHAENIIEHLSGVRDVHNTLRVAQSTVSEGSSQQATQSGQSTQESRH